MAALKPGAFRSTHKHVERCNASNLDCQHLNQSLSKDNRDNFFCVLSLGNICSRLLYRGSPCTVLVRLSTFNKKENLDCQNHSSKVGLLSEATNDDPLIA